MSEEEDGVKKLSLNGIKKRGEDRIGYDDGKGGRNFFFSLSLSLSLFLVSVDHQIKFLSTRSHRSTSPLVFFLALCIREHHVFIDLNFLECEKLRVALDAVATPEKVGPVVEHGVDMCLVRDGELERPVPRIEIHIHHDCTVNKSRLEQN